MNEVFGKDFHRKCNSVKRSGRLSEPQSPLKVKSCCPHPLPENQLLQKVRARRPMAMLTRDLRTRHCEVLHAFVVLPPGRERKRDRERERERDGRKRDRERERDGRGPLPPVPFTPTSWCNMQRCFADIHSTSRDLPAIAICDSNRESQIPSDLRQCEPPQKSSLFSLVV